MNRKASLLTLAFLSIIGFLQAQQIQLINSGEVIAAAKESYDSGKYENAIKQLLTVPARDTNYVYMLSELALAYIGNEKYAEALETCDKALKEPSEYRAQLLRLQAIATERKGDFEKAVSLFENAMTQYPFDVTIRYSLAIAYNNRKLYEKAIDHFFKILAINPYHSGCHLNMGLLAIRQGRKTHAVFSLGMYLSLNNTDNNRLVFLDKLLSNQITDESTLDPIGENACEKLDQVLKSKIALDKNYKTKVPMDAPVSKQTEMFFEQLSLIKKGTPDRWVEFYLPIYSFFKEQNYMEPFMYNILASSSNDAVAKWRKKNEKILADFYDKANAAIHKKRELLVVPASLGFKEPVNGWYYSGNKVEAIGKKQEEKRIGYWRYYHTNHELSAEGMYSDAGEKTGTWKYYSSIGAIKSIEDYTTGEVTVYYPEGGKHQHFFLKNDEIEGVAEVFDPCGNLIDKLSYVTGKRQGKGTSYYGSGKKKVEYEYNQDKATGISTSYYENGQISSIESYKEGVLEGAYTAYYANGKLRVKGAYVNDKVDSEWTYTYSNGKLEKKGVYKEGNATGEWIFYDNNGVLSEKRKFNEKGDWHGESVSYHQGVPHYSQTFKNGLLTKLVYFNKEGKILGSSENSSGTFDAKIFYASGKLNGEGAYKKGKVNGKWIYYYPEGSVLSEYTYVNGDAEGAAVEYYKNGAKRYDFQFKGGEYNGYYIEYFMDGSTKQQGWYQNGLRQQQWMVYYSNGKVSSDYYYEYDQLKGDAIEYHVDGKLFSVTTYKDSRATDIKIYQSTGNIISKKKVQQGKELFETNYASGKKRTVSELRCGTYSGAVGRWYPDGGVNFSYSNMNNNRHGEYEYKDISGQLIVKGSYVNGSEEGIWKWSYSTGAVETIGKYVSGDRDSTWINYYLNGTISSLTNYRNGKRVGVTQYFTPEGKLVLEKMYDNDFLVAYRKINLATNEGEAWIDFTGTASIVIKQANGTPAYEEEYKKGLIDGLKKIYYATGKPYSEVNYSLGDFNGTYTIYYQNGKVFDTGTYTMDELTGERKVYKENGSPLYTENYMLGYRQGKTTLFKDGAKAKEYTFWADFIE